MMKITYLLVVLFVVFFAWAYQSITPPPPKPLGPPDGLPITAPRIKLRDGRHLSYVESGVPKERAKAKMVFIHGFSGEKYSNPFATSATPTVLEELGAYIVSIDRPGYGESDPDPNRTVKSLVFDIEELADQLNLGSRFYVVGHSMGGQILWACLNYIPHRLAGAVLISPAINYRWPDLPSRLANEAYSRLLPQDQWAVRVAYYLPWLTYWWNSQKWFPYFSVIDEVSRLLSPHDIKIMSNLAAAVDPKQLQARGSQAIQQGKFESLHRDLIVAHGKWDFGPTDIKNPFPNNDGSVYIWMGDDDRFVSVELTRYIAQQLDWVKYHELAGAGHLMVYEDVVIDGILKELLDVKNN